MGVVVLFSGGLDSTTVAWDVVSNPFRYGLNQEDNEPVHLLTAAFSPEEVEKKATDLYPLIREIRAIDEDRTISHHVVEVPAIMESYTPDIQVPMSAMRILGPGERGSQLSSDRRKSLSLVFTPGLHLYLMSVAENLLSVPRLPFHGKQSILAGFQYEPETWDLHDAGRLDDSDTSPEWVAAVNKVLSMSPASVVFRAPFLEQRMTKLDILDLAMHVGVPVEETSSCLTGWKKACGYCGACIARSRTEAAALARDKARSARHAAEMIVKED
jgi:7-cyano-7-deazaguanine synthase in queuosine biosynthesis